jgi:hypothetical protein
MKNKNKSLGKVSLNRNNLMIGLRDAVEKLMILIGNGNVRSNIVAANMEHMLLSYSMLSLSILLFMNSIAELY